MRVGDGGDGTDCRWNEVLICDVASKSGWGVGLIADGKDLGAGEILMGSNLHG